MKILKISPGLGNTHNPLIFGGEPGWPLSKFQEIGSSRGNWMPSYQENKSLAGQGRGYKEFGFGARVWGAPPKGFDINYDDIAISTESIGPSK